MNEKFKCAGCGTPREFNWMCSRCQLKQETTELMVCAIAQLHGKIVGVTYRVDGLKYGRLYNAPAGSEYKWQVGDAVDHVRFNDDMVSQVKLVSLDGKGYVAKIVLFNQ